MSNIFLLPEIKPEEMLSAVSPNFFSVPYSEYKDFGYYDKDFIFHPFDYYTESNLKPVVYPDIFYNNLYNEQRYDVWIGGNGSGKSTNKAKQLLYTALDPEQYFRLLFVRHNHSDIKKSLYQLFKDVAAAEGISQYFRFYDSTFDIQCLVTGFCMYSAGLDNTGKLSGINDITDIWLEEPITIEDRKLVMISADQFDNLNTRLRTPKGPHKIHLTLNPINKDFFLYKNVLNPEIRPEDVLYDINDFNVCTSTYLDNPFLPESAIKVIENFKGARAAYGKYGVWAHQATGNEWLSNFDRGKHDKDVPFIKGVTVHSGFDFNMLPYQTNLNAQLFRLENDTLQIRFFQEYCLKPPLNVPEFAIQFLIDDYLKPYGYAPVTVYGDASGKYGVNNYRGIFEKLGIYAHEASDQVLRKNPIIRTARDLVNEMLEGQHGVEIVIDENCVNLISDLETLQTGPEGFDNEKKNGIEKKGHCYSAFVYIICKIFSYLLKENRNK